MGLAQKLLGIFIAYWLAGGGAAQASPSNYASKSSAQSQSNLSPTLPLIKSVTAAKRSKRVTSTSLKSIPRLIATKRQNTQHQKAQAAPKLARKAKKTNYPAVSLESMNTKESMLFRLYDQRGRYIKSAARRLSQLLRCHATGKKRTLDPALVKSVYQIGKSFPGRKLKIYSGYRTRSVSSLPNSYHVKGAAVDFAIDGVSASRLRDWLLAHFKSCCGVGYYPDRPFVHFDVRSSRAFWVDYSGKDEPAVYAANPYAAIQSEKAGISLEAQKKMNSASLSNSMGDEYGPATTSSSSSLAKTEDAADGNITTTSMGQLSQGMLESVPRHTLGVKCRAIP